MCFGCILNPFIPNTFTHLYQLDKSHFQIYGCWVVFFILNQISNETSVSKVSKGAASDLVLDSLSMSQKKDDRLIT